MFGSKKDHDSEPKGDFQIFVIYDSKVQCYNEPTFAVTKEDLIRGVLNTFRDPAQARNKYLVNAEDYSIFRIGSYTKKTGQIFSYPPEHMVNMHELRSLCEPLTRPQQQTDQQQALFPT